MEMEKRGFVYVIRIWKHFSDQIFYLGRIGKIAKEYGVSLGVRNLGSKYMIGWCCPLLCDSTY